MSATHRFEKRIPLPSTRQIRHELLMWADHELKKREARAITSETATTNTETAKAPLCAVPFAGRLSGCE
jgi:hypothetical protein